MKVFQELINFAANLNEGRLGTFDIFDNGWMDKVTDCDDVKVLVFD